MAYSSSSSSCAWQLGCRVARILVGRDYAADAVPLYQHIGTPFAELGRMTQAESTPPGVVANGARMQDRGSANVEVPQYIILGPIFQW